jgi:hypothetical protein
MDRFAIESILDDPGYWEREDVTIVDHERDWPEAARQAFERVTKAPQLSEEFSEIGEEMLDDPQFYLLSNPADGDDAINQFFEGSHWLTAEVTFADGTKVWTFTTPIHESFGLWAGDKETGVWLPV